MKLYIDPGTGSMLFTILLGVIGAAFYSVRMMLIKLRMRAGGGKVDLNQDRIPLVIFSDHKRYWNVFQPICRELDKRGVDVVYMTASEDDPALNCTLPHVRAEFIGPDNKVFTRLNFLRANLVLSTTPGLDVYQWKRSRDVNYYVHIPHAASDITMYRMFGIDYYDALLLSGDYQMQQVRDLEQLRQLPAKELTKVGIPYMDEMAKRLENADPIPAHERTVLLAPSWGPSAIFSVYGGKIIEKLLQTGYHVIIRPHPQSYTSEKEMLEKLMQAYPESDQLEWNRDNDNFDVLNRSDILISDFSGVVFEFSLIYDKPVIYTDPKMDLSVYDAWWLDQTIWTVTALPRLGEELRAENMDDLKDLIDRCLSDPRYAEGRRQVKEETWANSGNGAAATADYLIAKLNELSN